MFKQINPAGHMSTWKPGSIAYSRFFFLCAAGLFICGVINLAGQKFSLARIGMFGLAFLFCGGLGWLSWQTRRAHAQKLGTGSAWLQSLAKQKNHLYSIIVTTLIFMASWFVIWTPLESFGKYYYYLLGVYPFVVWLTCASGAASFLLTASRYGINIQGWLKSVRSQRDMHLFSLAALGIFGLLAIAVAVRVVGVQPDEEGFWYGAGVPVVTFQVFTALIVGIASAFVINKILNQLTIKPAGHMTVFLDFSLFLLIWGLSAWYWAGEPVKPDFLITQPVAPNFQMYPDYDARLYDVMSQFALIGQGINNHSFFDRVLYPAFLTYIHTLAGQDYSQVMAVQAGIFAIIPALIYLIGNSIYNRAGGISLAILTTLRGINSINIGNIINTSHQKQILTEFPTAVLLVLTTWLLIKWLQYPKKNWILAGLAGAVIGLSSLVRPHTLLLIPFFLIMVFFAYRHEPAGHMNRIRLGISILFLTAALFSILPWVQFGGQNVSIFTLYFTRIQNVIQQRYPTRGSYDLNNLGQSNLPITEPLSIHEADYFPSTKTPKSIWAFTADNFLNNLVTSVQSLPNTPLNLDARTVVKKTDNYWKPYWDGSLTGWAKFCTFLNLILLALGLGIAWRRARWIGMLPLIILAVYYLANSFSRTSGGRYLVPADWVILIYYVLGLFAVLESIKNFFNISTESEVKHQPFSFGLAPWWLGASSVLAVSFFLGSTIPLAQVINPIRYPSATPEQQASTFISAAGSKLNLSVAQLNNFLSTNNAVILTGRSLYPRQFAKNEGLDISVYNYYHPLPYPRTLFTIIGRNGENVIILPHMEAAKIPNATDLMVVGCKADGYILAWAVIRLDDQSVFERTPTGAPLACPLPNPICDTNKGCQ